MPTKQPKPPIDPARWQAPPIGSLPEFPSADLTVVPLPGDAPEDVVVDADGQIWTGLEDGKIMRIPAGGGEPVVVANTGGRPLGMHVARDGRILICDSPRGLLALDPTDGTIETLAQEVDNRKLTFCSNVTETDDGTIYFTETTSAFTYESALGAVLEARPRGSLLRRTSDGAVSTVLSGLHFANGLTLTADGSALVFAETLERRLSKYWLTGSSAGTVTSLVTNLPGMPDNVSTGADGKIWCALTSRVLTAVDRFLQTPPFVRKLVWRMVPRVQPKLKLPVWAAAFDPESGKVMAGLRTEHSSFGAVTGIVEADGRLWLGTIGSPAVAHVDLIATAL